MYTNLDVKQWISLGSEAHVAPSSSNFTGRFAHGWRFSIIWTGWNNEFVRRINIWCDLICTLIGKPLFYLISRASLGFNSAIAGSLLLIHRIFVLEGILQVLFMENLSTRIRRCTQDNWPALFHVQQADQYPSGPCK